MSTLYTAARPKLSFAALAVALLSGVVFLLALMQGESGRYFSKTLSLERGVAKAVPTGEFGYRVALPRGYRDNQRVVERGSVLEDGVPLPLKIEKIKYVADKGRGRYRITQRTIYLSAPDNSDPRSNGRRYELQVPRQLRPALFWVPLCLLAASMFYLQRAGPPPLPTWHLRRWVEPALVLAVSSATMLWSLGHFADHSDGWLVVKGSPFSDSIAWVELAKSLSDGRGFSGPFEAHRGGYPLLLGGFFSLAGGGSVMLAKVFNAIMLSVGATAVYLLARSAFGRGIGILLLVGLLMGARFEVAVEMTLTEPTGFALAAVGLHQLYRACLKPAFWRFAVVGVFLGLSNLVRPFTLLALPIFGALILYVAIRQRWGWRRFATLGAAYVGGAMLVFGPWVLRQKLAWGVATLDLNSAVMLYGAAVPPEGDERRSLSSRHYHEGDAAGFERGDHGPRYHYYMRRYREEVAADTAGYLGFLAGQFVEFFAMPGLGDGHVRQEFGVVFFLALAWLAWRRKFPPLVLAAGLWPLLAPLLEDVPVLLVVGVAAASAFAFHRGASRVAVLILVLTLVGAAVLNALVGNFALNRGTIFTEWMVFLIVAAGMVGLARLVAGIAAEPVGGVEANGRFSDFYPPVLLAVFAAGFLMLGAKKMTATLPDRAAWIVPDEVAQRALGSVGARVPATAGLAEDQFYFSRVRVGEYRWFIPAGVDLGHWARPFEVRPFDRTMAMPLRGYNEDLKARLGTVNFPGDQTGIDGQRDFLLVGLRNLDEEAALSHGELVVEALALIPYDPAAGELDLDGGMFFDPPPDL